MAGTQTRPPKQRIVPDEPGYRFVVWGRMADLGWQRDEVILAPGDTFHLVDKHGPAVVIEFGDVGKPFDPKTLPTNVIEVQV